jgi:RNA polymerase sigma factor (sigma-70 family)
MSISDDHSQRCIEGVDQLLAVYDWQLIERSEFIHLTIAACQHTPTIEVRYLALGVYNSQLYLACTGQQGTQRWERGYEELFTMLRDRAQHLYPDIWEDVAQSALEQVCAKLQHCKEPRAFFQFAWGYAQNAARSLRPYLRRTYNTEVVSFERAVHDDLPTLAEQLADPNAVIEEIIVSDERQREIRLRIAAIEHKNPRAAKQIMAVTLKYLDGLDDLAISQRLQVSVKSVHELRTRGLRKLRADVVLSAFLSYVEDI